MSYQYKSIIKAVREVKRLLVEEYSDRVILLAHKLSGTYFVYTDASATEWMLEQLFLDYTDVSPEEFIDQFAVIDYSPRTMIENFDVLYSQFRPTLFSEDFYRGHISLEPEYSVEFNISYTRKYSEGATKNECIQD